MTPQEIISGALADAKSPVLLTSFGKDSLLLMSIAREIRPDIGMIWFRNGSDESFAKRMMVEWDLRVLSWAPTESYVVSNGAEMSLVSEYAWNDVTFPVVTDIFESSDCKHKQIRTPRLFHDFDVAFLGWKECDRHWLMGSASYPPVDGAMIGGTRLYAPLRDWTDERVWAEIAARDIPTDDKVYQGGTDEIGVCRDCIESLSRDSGYFTKRFMEAA